MPVAQSRAIAVQVGGSDWILGILKAEPIRLLMLQMWTVREGEVSRMVSRMLGELS